jgi:hypothetical protein
MASMLTQEKDVGKATISAETLHSSANVTPKVSPANKHTVKVNSQAQYHATSTTSSSGGIMYQPFAPSVEAMFAHHKQQEYLTSSSSSSSSDLNDGANVIKNMLGMHQRQPMPRGPTSQPRGPFPTHSTQPIMSTGYNVPRYRYPQPYYHPPNYYPNYSSENDMLYRAVPPHMSYTPDHYYFTQYIQPPPTKHLSYHPRGPKPEQLNPQAPLFTPLQVTLMDQSQFYYFV